MSLQANEECQHPGEKYCNCNMSDTKYDSKADTLEHIKRVQYLLEEVRIILMNRAWNHDLSKLESPEKEGFDLCVPKLKTLEYGSKEYKDCLVEMQETLNHHYRHNPHHPEHWKNGVDDMSLFDIIEMLIDWKAATERMKDGGDIYKSIEFNTGRFNLSEQLKKILLNTCAEMGWKKKVNIPEEDKELLNLKPQTVSS